MSWRQARSTEVTRFPLPGSKVAELGPVYALIRETYEHLFRFAYRVVVTCLVAAFYIPHLARMIPSARFKPGTGQRLGFLPREMLRQIRRQDLVWLHASAAGEMVAAAPIVRALQQMAPELGIALSTTNEEGMAMARRLLPGLRAVFYFPLDLPFITTRVLRRVRPRAFVMVEAEVWPNFLYDARRLGVRTVLTNGMVEPRSPMPYHGLPAPFYRFLLETIDVFGARDKTDERNLLSWGIPGSRIRVTGSSKFDQMPAPASVEETELLRRRLQIDDGRPCLVAGCTHPGEELFCLDAFRLIRREIAAAFLVLAPMDVRRAQSLIKVVRECSLSGRLWTEVPNRESYDVLVLDTMGELSRIYATATLAFVGGSIMGDLPGHNPWEPLSQGKPVSYGPYMRQPESDLLEQEGVAFRVSQPQQLAERFITLVRSAKTEALGNHIFELVERRRGAGKANAELILRVVSRDGSVA